MAVNKVILVGFVGIDPEVRYLDSGTPVANFRMATSENYTNRNGEKITQTEWHNIVLWRKLAEIAEKYVRKGSQLYIEGRIRTRSWDDKDGNKRYTTEIIADSMQMLDRKGTGPSDENSYQESGNYSGSNNSSSQPTETPQQGGDDDQVDDLPF